MKMLQACASKRLQQKAVVDTSPGQMCVGNDWLRRRCPPSAPASPEPLKSFICSVTPFERDTRSFAL